MAKQRKIIVSIAISIDGYIARPDGDVEWLTRRPAPKGFYGMNAFMRSVDATVLGRKTFDVSVSMGAKFDPKHPTYVFSRHAPPASIPAGVEFVTESIGQFVGRLRKRKGKNIWLMGGGEIIAAFLDDGAIDEFMIGVIPIIIGEGIPLIAPRHRDVPLRLESAKPFPDGVVMLRYVVGRPRAQ
jgi:dihydrofolate reductase